MTLCTSSPSIYHHSIESLHQHQTKLSKVLLVCVYNTIVFEISNQLVYQTFNPFGNVLHILIFQRKEITKFFVEFQLSQEAEKAKESLDGKKIFNNICKMSIYFSTFTNVDLKHSTSEGIQFTSDIYDHNSYLFGCNVSSVKSVNEKKLMQNQNDFDEFSAFGINGVHRLDTLSNNHYNHSNQFYPRSKTMSNQLEGYCNQIGKRRNVWGQTFNIDDFCQSEDIANCQSEDWCCNSQTNSTRNDSETYKCQQNKNNNLTVVGFKIRNSVKHTHLYNLFSNFGNISAITVKKNDVKIKFRTVEFAEIAKTYLNNKWLYNNKIELESYESNSCWPEEGQFAEIVCYDDSSNRFTEKKSINMNPPSKTLHISGMKKERCTTQQINCMFKHVVPPLKVKVLKHFSDKSMALIEFASLEESFDVMANCHNMVVGGRKIQISFTKSQI